MTIHTGVSTGDVTASYEMPDDGTDVVDEASVRVALEGLTDDVARLAVGKQTSKTRLLGFVASSGEDTGVIVWNMQTDGRWVQNEEGSGGRLGVQLHLPDGVNLDAFEVWITPSVATRGSLPTNMPRVILSKIALATGTVTELQNVVDGSATVGAYEARHAIDQNGIGEVINNATHTYWLTLRGEYGGAGYVAGLLVDVTKITHL